MKKCHWPYSGINKEELLAKIISVEKILKRYGAEYIEDCCENCTSMLNKDFYVQEKNQKRIWKRGNEYIRVDKLYFPEKPFLVLEFSEYKEGPYEDADPFPYDLSDAELEQEIRCSLNI